MSRHLHPTLDLRWLPAEFSILRFDPLASVPGELLEPTPAFVSVTRTPAELSVICPTALAASLNVTSAGRSDGWRCLRIELASLPDETPGIVAAVVNPLALAGISTFAVATFDTDHVLVQDVEAATAALTGAGHTVATATETRNPTATDDSATATVRFRAATAHDSSELAILADAATRRLVAWLWDDAAEPGQSSFEVGRSIIHADTSSLTHHSQWRAAELNGQLVGGLNSYLMAPADSTAATNEVLAPLAELKAIAADTWYISVASVFPEARGNGIGKALLSEAERLGRAAGATQLTLLVASFNPDALRLYERRGFREHGRRTFKPFPGSGETGDWLLMIKDIDLG